MFTTAIILEKRTPKNDGTFPVKLRVIVDRKASYFSLGVSLTPNEFDNAFSANPRGRLKTIADKLRKRETDATTILHNLEPLDLNRFKTLFSGKPTSKTASVGFYFNQYIDELENDQRHGTASNYRCAMNCLNQFSDVHKLTFKQITPEFLKRYALQMEKDGKTKSTVGIYLRPLRALFRKAQINNDAPKENPFGAGAKQFRIPTSEKHPRPLEITDIALIYNHKSVNPETVKYKDFFILSYLLCGLNFRDLLTIRWRQIDGNILTVTREKTKRTSNGKTIQLEINEPAQQIIDKYATPEQSYVFPFIDERDNPKVIQRKVQNFTRNTNQALKKIAKRTGISQKISTVYARHSAASHGIQNGASVADISAALGHVNIKTTSNYISALQSGRAKLSNGLAANLLTPTNQNIYENQNVH